MTVAWATFPFRPDQSSGAVHQSGLGKQKDSGFPRQLYEHESKFHLVFFCPVIIQLPLLKKKVVSVKCDNV